MDRIKVHENKYYQLLIFCITCFGIVFGLNDKISKEFIPIILSMVLYIASNYGNGNWILKSKAHAYLYMHYNKATYNTNYEAFGRFFVRRYRLRLICLLVIFFVDNYDKRIKHKWISSILKYRSLFSNPYSIIYIIYFLSIIYFSVEFLNECFTSQLYKAIIYILVICLFSFLILRSIFKVYKYDFDFFVSLYNSYRKQYVDK